MRGFTLIEAMVALLLLSVTATALCQSLLLAERFQGESGRSMRAVSLAEQAIERTRLQASSGNDNIDVFSRQWSSTDAGGGLRRIEVIVDWPGHEYRLQTLVTD